MASRVTPNSRPISALFQPSSKRLRILSMSLGVRIPCWVKPCFLATRNTVAREHFAFLRIFAIGVPFLRSSRMRSFRFSRCSFSSPLVAITNHSTSRQRRPCGRSEPPRQLCNQTSQIIPLKAHFTEPVLSHGHPFGINVSTNEIPAGSFGSRRNSPRATKGIHDCVTGVGENLNQPLAEQLILERRMRPFLLPMGIRSRERKLLTKPA